MAKLTLSVDKRVISRAKRYAKQRGISVSKVVETYLAAVSEPPPASLADAPPVLQRLRGSLKRADLKDYKKYLAHKNR